MAIRVGSARMGMVGGVTDSECCGGLAARIHESVVCVSECVWI